MDKYELEKLDRFDRWLTRLQSGEVSAEACLQAMSSESEALASLMQIAAESHELLAPSSPRPGFASASRTRVLKRLREARSGELRQRAWLSTRIPRRFGFFRPAFAGVAIILVLTLLGSSVGVAYASSDSLPGDSLYGVKLGLEDARLALTLNPLEDAKLLLRFSETRLGEIETLVTEGRSGDIDAALAAYDDEITQLTELTGEIPAADGEVTLGTVEAALAKHLEVLARVQAQVPEAAQPGINNAIERSKHGQAVVDHVRNGGKPSDLAPGQGKEGGHPGGKDGTPGLDPEKTPGKPDHQPGGRPDWVTPGPPDNRGPPDETSDNRNDKDKNKDN